MKHTIERLRCAKERMHWNFSDEKDSTWMVLMGSNIIFMA